MNNFEDMDFTNMIRDDELVRHFRNNRKRKVFILTEAFPFMFIGKIKGVVEDMVVLDVQTTSIPALEDREWTIHVHSIEVFYIETGYWC